MAARTASIGAKLTLNTGGFSNGLGVARDSLAKFMSEGERQGMKLKKLVDEIGASNGKLASKLTLKPGFQGASSPLHTQLMPDAEKADAGIRRAILSTNGLEKSTSKAGQAMQQATGKSSRLGMGLLQLGYVADDAQYGMRGVMNNIAPLVMGMGMGAGVAGVLQILGTVIQQTVIFWDDFTGATGRAAKATAMAAQETKNLAAATDEAGKVGAKQLLAEQRSRELREAGGAANDRRIATADRLRQLEADASKAGLATPRAHLRTDAQNAALDAERIKKENEMDRQNENASVQERLTEARRKLVAEQKQLARIGPQVLAGEPRLEELQAEKATRDDALEDIGKRIEANRKKGGFRSEMANQDLYNRRASLQADNEEQAALEQSMPGLRAERDKLENSTLPSQITALEQEAGPEAKARERMRKLKEEAAQIEAGKEGFEEATNLVVRALKKVGGEFVYLGQVAQMGMEKARAAAVSNDRKRDLLISETRSPRRREKLQRAADLADETKRLMGEDPKLSEGEALDEAERGIRVKEKASGKRRIRGAGPARQFEGLDGFKRSRSNLDHGEDKPLPGEREKEAAKERGKRALEGAKAAVTTAGQSGKDAGSGVFQEMLTRLDRLIEAVTKTPAERLKPARSS